MLHICGENLENAHDAMSDTVALKKIAEQGAVSQGKNYQKLSMCNEFIRCFHQFELIQTTFIFNLSKGGPHHFLNLFLNINQLLDEKKVFKNDASQQTFGTSYFSNAKTKGTSHFS